MSWVVALAAIALGVLLLKAIFDPDTNIYKCPNCGLTIAKNTPSCRRCDEDKLVKCRKENQGPKSFQELKELHWHVSLQRF